MQINRQDLMVSTEGPASILNNNHVIPVLLGQEDTVCTEEYCLCYCSRCNLKRQSTSITCYHVVIELSGSRGSDMDGHIQAVEVRIGVWGLLHGDSVASDWYEGLKTKKWRV